MSSPTDDLPWPELGNVSRGATRGNQGQKGVLGPPDRDGCSTLQLRVHPGVLAVRLNRQASDWYRTLDSEVNRALKLTKTYWRKARRRQDYDARADQDHMELHEWLQQLKDKTMSHLELLMQKGDIQGPPYVMPDDIELSFLRKFMERHNENVPHNPRLRHGGVKHHHHHQQQQQQQQQQPIMRSNSDSLTPEPSDHGYATMSDNLDHHSHVRENGSDGSNSHIDNSATSPSMMSTDTLTQEYMASKHALQSARATLSRAQKDAQATLLRYTSFVEAETQARRAVSIAEKRYEEIMTVVVHRTQTPNMEPRSRQSSLDGDERQVIHGYHHEDHRGGNDGMHSSRSSSKPISWSENQNIYAHENNHPPQFEEEHLKIDRKHSRNWDRNEEQYVCDDLALPPRKRVQHNMMANFDVLNVPLQAQNMSMQSS